jgi:hypothetical protein
LSAARERKGHHLQRYLGLSLALGDPAIIASTLGADFHTRAEWGRYVTGAAARWWAPVEIKLEKR